MAARPTTLSILIIDENRLRASVIESGLRDAGYTDLTVVHDVVGIARRIADIEPDVIVISLENPNRDMLENMFQLSRAVQRPIAMFVDRSDQAAIEAAVEAGVSAYVVDGLKRERVKPILDMAISRFNAFSRMARELREARSELVWSPREFLKQPPKGTRRYDGGLVFKPAGNVADDEYNLYRGLFIEPDPSGSCSLLHDLINEVWAARDEKDLITGDRILINPKFKAPMSVDNYARFVVVSNASHFLSTQAAERRYTVLESTSAWQGTNKFAELLDQWQNGGAARFVYEALNHSFRHLEGRQELLINTKLDTEAAACQTAHSRNLLERCFVDLLVSGHIEGTQFNRWKLDEGLEIEIVAAAGGREFLVAGKGSERR